MSSLGMTQFVCEPTRVSKTNSDNILDLIFSNDPISVHVSNHMPPLSTSDHHIIEFSIFFPSNTNNLLTNDGTPSVRLPIYDWTGADFTAINEDINNLDWNRLFGTNFDVESIWNSLKSMILLIIELHNPKVLIDHSRKYKPRMYPKHIRNLLSRKAAIWRKFKLTGNPEVKFLLRGRAHII